MKVKAQGLFNAIEALGLNRLVDKELPSGQLDEIRKAAASWSEIDLATYSNNIRFALLAAYEVFLRKSSNDIQKARERLGTCVESGDVSEVEKVLVSVLADSAQETSGGHLEPGIYPMSVNGMPVNWGPYKKYLNTGIPAPEPPVLGSIDPLSVIIMQMESLISLLPQVRSRVDNVGSSAFKKVTTYVSWNALRVITSWWLWELREIRQKDDDEALEACVDGE